MNGRTQAQVFAVFADEVTSSDQDTAGVEKLLAENYTLSFQSNTKSEQYVKVFLNAEASKKIQHLSTAEYELIFCGDSYPGDSIERIKATARSLKEILAKLEAIDGHFIFFLWDRINKKLHVGNDLLGWNALYYYELGNSVVFGSDFAFLKRTLKKTSINLNYLTQYVLGSFNSSKETIQHSIKRLAPAHRILTSKLDGAKQERYWQPKTIKEINQEEVQNEVRRLLSEAIEKRKHLSSSIGLMLSGGLDSSILAACDQQRKTSSSLKWHSLFFPGEACDESKYINALSKKYGAEVIAVDFSQSTKAVSDLKKINAEISRTGSFPNYPNGSLVNLLRSTAAKNVEYLMTGYGGDELFSGLHAQHSSQISQRLLAHFCSLIKSSKNRLSNPDYFGLRKSLKLLSSTVKQNNSELCFANRTRFSQYREQTLLSGTAVHYRELETTYSNIQMLHPYYDRDLIDFCFSIPEKYFGKHGDYKALLRNSFFSELPDEIRRRKDKASFEFIWQECLQQMNITALSFSHLADLGLINVDEVRLLAKNISNKKEQRFESLVFFWNLLAAEQLLSSEKFIY